MRKKRIITIGLVLCLLVLAACGVFTALQNETKARTLSLEEAEQFVNTEMDNIAVSKVMQAVAERSTISVTDIRYGEEKDIVLTCSVKTLDIHAAISPEYDAFLSADEKKKNGTMFKSALDFKLEFEPMLLSLLATAPEKEAAGEIYLYDTKNGLALYASDAAVNLVYGGIADIGKDIAEKNTTVIVSPNGERTEKPVSSANLKKGFLQCIELRQNAKPDTATPLGAFWNSLKKDFTRNFIESGRWKTIFTGLWVTIKLTVFALLIGIVLGFLVAFVRCTYLKTTRHGLLLRLFDRVCRVYLTVIRGTPVVVQIMIIYFVIFMPLGVDKFLAAVICFGLNSGAYVAEIVRGGIMSVDDGQMEAGRSLGFGYMPTMLYIVFPQAFKAVLPALANEFVVLLKETSIAFYIGLGDLMYAGNAIRAATYSAFMPLICVAVIYLVMVLTLQHLVTLLERRLRSSER